jgi:hypothetical protein
VGDTDRFEVLGSSSGLLLLPLTGDRKLLNDSRFSAYFGNMGGGPSSGDDSGVQGGIELNTCTDGLFPHSLSFLASNDR